VTWHESSPFSVKQAVLEAAREYTVGRGWPWQTPVEVTLTRNASPDDRQWTVNTNVFAAGRNARIVVRERDMVIIESGYLAR
jgi:hypothetical protein